MIPQPFRLVAGPGARNGWCLQMARVGNCLGVWSAVALSAMLVACAPLSGQTTRQENIHQHAHDVMPFDLSKTVHIFKMTEHGGVQRVVTREAGTRDEVALIQQHLMHEAAQFQNGNYADPATLHGTGMPGIKELQEGAPRIKISYAALPDGAEITFETTDLHLVTAVHRWFGAQLSEHGADARTECMRTAPAIRSNHHAAPARFPVARACGHSQAHLAERRLVFKLIAGTALAVASALGIANTAVAAPPRPGLAYQVTYSVTVDPSFSPDGKRMVYISVIAGREQLLIADVDGANPVQITHDDYDHEDPAWSPDGSKIAFVSLKDGGEVISMMNVDGSGVEALSPANVRAIHPNWGPDSRTLAYCTDDDLKPPAKNASDIDAIDIVTRKITLLISGGVNTYPSLSPDGKRMAFRRILGELNSEVFIANADGSEQVNLTAHPAFDGWPSWSPDGAQIAFASNRRANYQVYVMKPDGTDVRLVANTEGRATAPVWSKDGATIYFTICTKVDFSSDCEIFAAPAPPVSATAP